MGADVLALVRYAAIVAVVQCGDGLTEDERGLRLEECDFCSTLAPTVYVAASLPGGRHRYCRGCLAKRDGLLSG